MRLLVDTCAYSLAMRGNAQAQSAFRRADELLLCPVVSGELQAGFTRGRRTSHNQQILAEFIASSRVRVCAITLDTSEFYGRILNDLRQIGSPIPTNDIWIAACAQEAGAKVLTADAHFLKIPGLLCDFLTISD
jgi:tRNA(fMet)-specific endonuclease VapC